MAIIRTLVPFSGVRASVIFQDGVGETRDPWLIKWFKDHGYTVEEEAGQPKAPEGDLDLDAMTVAQLKAHAATHGIELGKARNKAGIVSAIQAMWDD